MFLLKWIPRANFVTAYAREFCERQLDWCVRESIGTENERELYYCFSFLHHVDEQPSTIYLFILQIAACLFISLAS